MKEEIFVEAYVHREFKIFGYRFPYKKKIKFRASTNIAELDKCTLKDVLDGKVLPMEGAQVYRTFL
jgi:hypothetical protein